MRGFFITFEGIDGCGKSTHLRLIADALRSRRLDCVTTREPGGTPVGERIRDIMLADVSVDVVPEVELFLMSAARAQHIAGVIKPALAAGRIVISDRHADSTVAFQGYGRGLDLNMVERVNRYATDGIAPDLTLLFDVDPEIARRRLNARPVGGWLGAVDEEGMDFHRRVRQGYLEIAAGHPKRVRVVDASGSLDDTHRRALALVLETVTGAQGSAGGEDA